MDIQPIKNEVEMFLYENQEIVINNNEDYLKAGDTVKSIRLRIQSIDSKRKEWTKPLDEAKKRIMEDIKTLIEPLEKLEKDIKDRMIIFYKIEQNRLNEEQKRIEEEAKNRIIESGELEAIVPVVNDIKTQNGEFAKTTVRKVWVYEIEDLDKIPKEYWIIDEKLIKEAIRNGARKIDGLKIYQKENITTR